MLRRLHKPYWSPKKLHNIVATNLIFFNDNSGVYGRHRYFKKQSKNIRHNVPDTEELAKSIQQKGLLQPILVRTLDGYFEIVAGNRRFCACKALGWKKIACHIIELVDKQAFEVSLVENIQRKTISPLDEANAFKAYVSDFGWGGVSDLASKIG
ncbi:MAG: ParB/RepB/Spo0J family partition protein [Candidatus Nitrosopolaris sp.]